MLHDVAAKAAPTTVPKIPKQEEAAVKAEDVKEEECVKEEEEEEEGEDEDEEDEGENGEGDNVRSLTDTLQEELVDSHIRAIQAFCTTHMRKLLPGWPVISTSTLTVKTSMNRIDYWKIVEKVTAAEIQGLSLKKDKNGVSKVFRNCASFSVLLEGKAKGVKICANGTLHLTGVKCGAHAKAMLGTAIRGIEAVHETAGKVKVIPDSMKLNMINYYFPLNVRLDLDALKRVILSRHQIAVLYDREKHPGVKFRSPSKKTTIIVFMTGKVFLSTKKSADDIFDAFKFIATIVEENLQTVMETETSAGKNKVKKKAEINLIEEIPSEDWDEIFDGFPFAASASEEIGVVHGETVKKRSFPSEEEEDANRMVEGGGPEKKKSRRGRKTTAEHTDANAYLTDLLGLQ